MKVDLGLLLLKRAVVDQQINAALVLVAPREDGSMADLNELEMCLVRARLAKARSALQEMGEACNA